MLAPFSFLLLRRYDYSPGFRILTNAVAGRRFELFTGSELQLNIHDEWRNVSHYRVVFRSYESLMKDPNSEAIFKSWPKPLTIEFLDEEYQKWSLDLTSLCWDGREVREFGGSGSGGSKQGDASVLL